MSEELRHYTEKDLHNLTTLDTGLKLTRGAKELLELKGAKDTVTMTREDTGEKIIVDYTVLAIWRGMMNGAKNEEYAEGLGDVVSDIIKEDQSGE